MKMIGGLADEFVNELKTNKIFIYVQIYKLISSPTVVEKEAK